MCTQYILILIADSPWISTRALIKCTPFNSQGRPINDIEYYGCPPWPDMQDLINHCLQYVPQDRPSAQQVFDRLCSTEFVCLKRAIPVGRNSTLETFTTRVGVCVCVCVGRGGV